jgi:hypothetical protein
MLRLGWAVTIWAETGIWNKTVIPTGPYFGPSGIVVPAVSTSVATIKGRYFSLLLLRGPYFSTRNKAGRVLKFCMGS